MTDSSMDSQRKLRRRKALLAASVAVALAACAYAIYWVLALSPYEETDNAYVQGNVVQLTSQISGTVVAFHADETDHVKAGQLLVELDPADSQIALDQARAQLAQTVREVRTLYANNSVLRAQVTLREADLARSQSDLKRAESDFSRREQLASRGMVSAEALTHARTELAAGQSRVAAARAALLSAGEQLLSSQTMTDGTSVGQHPNVVRAAVRVREAHIALARTKLLAPVDGFVAKRIVQLGQRAQPGTPLLSVITLDQIWVEANFKESQLQRIRLGQTVTLVADVYGKRVTYHGTIGGLGAGTGAAFALLPAQNATGNWIKVVQRVPVRIVLDPKEIAGHPLRIGLSMVARVDVGKTDGRMLADASQPPSVARTTVFDQSQSTADAEADIGSIIAANDPASRRSR